MSNIPLARAIINSVVAHTSRTNRAMLLQALSLMKRETPCRRANRQRRVINAKTRKRILTLAKNQDLTLHQIANAVGLRSSGRVSDVLHGKR